MRNWRLSISWLTLLLSLNSTSGASVVAIDNKIEQAMVTSFLFYLFVFEGGWLFYLQRDTAYYDGDAHSLQVSALTGFVAHAHRRVRGTEKLF